MSRHSQNVMVNQSHSNIGGDSTTADDAMSKMMGAGHKSSKDKPSRSGSGLPSSSNLQRVGGVNSVINNISSGIAQKK